MLSPTVVSFFSKIHKKLNEPLWGDRARNKRHSNKNRRGGYIILLLTSVMSMMSFSVIMTFYSGAFAEYRTAVYQAKHARALYLAQSALEAATLILRRVPTNQMAMFAMLSSPPPMPLGDGIISYTMQEQTGKININRLVRFSADEGMNLATRDMIDRLSESLGISYEIWDAVIDYIDSDNTRMPAGHERLDYELLTPPRRIKNGRLHSVEELLLVPGFNRQILYEDLRTEEKKEETSEDFLSEEELLAITDEDYILANNITVDLTDAPENTGKKININSAPYHVLLAVSEYMTPEAAKKIVIERVKNGGRLSSIDDLKELPELSIRTTGELTLFDELKLRTTDQDTLYKIVAEGSVDSQTAQVSAVFDKAARKLTMYRE